MDHVQVHGLRIAYRHAGHGPAVVLCHGGISDGREWSRQLDGLSDRFSLYAWDAPGCGASDDPDEHTFRLPDYADALAGFVDALDLDRPAVVGLSFGSGLALQLYERHPTLVSALVLVSPYAGWAGSLPEDEVRRRLDQADRESRLPPEAFVPDWVPGLLTEHAPPGLVDELVGIMSDFHPSGYRTMARSFAEADLRHVLPTIAVPLLVVCGERDARSPVEVGEWMADAAPDAELAVLAGASHMGTLETPSAFNAVVDAFLHAHPPPGAGEPRT